MKLKSIFMEAFRDGTASHFDSLLKKWAKDAGVEYEWKFNPGKDGKSKSYFVLKLNYDEYVALPTDQIVKLNGLFKQFHVDFKYNGGRWSPVIE